MSDHALVLLFTVLFPAVCACTLFLILRKATRKRRLLTFFIGLPFFVVPTLVLLTDFPGILEGAIGGTAVGAIPSAVQLSLTAALGAVYLGVSAAVCSERVLKVGGLLFLSVVTLVSFALEFVLCYLTLVYGTGKTDAPTLGAVAEGLQGTALADLSVRFCVFLVLILFTVCFFLSFLWLRRSSDLQTEDIIRLHREEEKERLIEKEGVCAVCRYAVPSDDNPLQVVCDKKGVRDSDARCPRFEYDPLKRIPEKTSRRD